MPVAAVPQLADLQYDTFDALKQKCNKLNPSLVRSVQSSKTTTEKVYLTMVKRSFDEANLMIREGNQEGAYVLLSRCGELSQLMMKKDDFTSFKRTSTAKAFHTLFKTVLEKIEELETSLERRYQLHVEELQASKKEKAEFEQIQDKQRRFGRDLPTDGRPTNAVYSTPPKTISDSEIALLVSPKQLIGLVDPKAKSTKSVIVLDFRDDNDRRSLFKYSDTSRISVVNIPAGIIQPGCIAGKLVNQLPVNERGLLQKLKEADLVVLMESKKSPLSADSTQLSKGSKAQMLFDAIFLYNTQYNLKRRPAVLDGGFENWSMHYPMYTTAAEPDRLNDVTEQAPIGDSFEAEVARFRRQFSLNVDYPNLDYIPPPPAQPEVFFRELDREPRVVYPEPSREVRPPASRPNIPDRSLKPSSSIPRPPTPPTTTTPENASNSKPADISAEVRRLEVVDRSGEEQGPVVANENTSVVDEAPKLDDGVYEVYEEQLKPTIARPTVDRSVKPALNQDQSRNVVIHGGEADISRSIPDEPRAAGAGLPHSKEFTNGAQQPTEEHSPKLLGGARAQPPASRASGTPEPSATAVRHGESGMALRPRPSVDRSTKPSDASTEEFHSQLMNIYRRMCDDIRQQSTLGRVTPGSTGLYNQGNTCFMNATLQALSNAPQLREIFANRKFIHLVNRNNRFGTQGVISTVFGALIDSMWSGQFRAINPSQFLATFASSVNRDMGDRRQHDAQEFQIFLLGALHEDLNSVTIRKSIEQKNEGKDLVTAGREAWRNALLFSRSPVNDIFQLQAVSILQCSVCRMQSPTFEEMTQGLTLELPDNRRSVSLSDCLRQHFAREILDGASRWMCPRCQRMQVATKQTSIWRLPSLLVVHLKRFSQTISGWVKNEVAVDFPVNYLDLSELMHPDTDAPPVTYSLFAVTNHFGRLESGHYTSFARNSQTQQWLKFDDEVVSPIGVEGSVKTGAAYILFYARD